MSRKETFASYSHILSLEKYLYKSWISKEYEFIRGNVITNIVIEKNNNRMGLQHLKEIFYIDSHQEKRYCSHKLNFSQLNYTQKYFIIFFVRSTPGLSYYQIHAHFHHIRAVLHSYGMACSSTLRTYFLSNHVEWDSESLP